MATHGAVAHMFHNPHDDFDDDLLPIGATYWVRLTEHLLAA
jgi:hippurate hydrolase